MIALPFLLLFATPVPAAAALPVLRSNAPLVTIQDGEVTKRNGWRLAPEVDPDVYEAELIQGRPHQVTFSSDVESIRFMVEEGKQYDFVIRFGDKDCHTRIVGIRFTPAAEFDAAYRAAHQGKIVVEVPEVYELINVALAMTPTGLANRELVYHDSEYYGRVRAWFVKFAGHPLLAALEAELSQSTDRYFPLKMNGYAFEFDGGGRIVQSKVFDRTGFAGSRHNALRPYLELLQSFADASDFRAFYRQNAGTYEEQIAFFRDVAEIGEMKRWLDSNFPASSGYDCQRVIFSPLVAYNQSATWFESNGFEELQAHVNFPYPQDLKRHQAETLSPRAAILFRGSIVFTELNHGYINPEAEKHADRVLAAVGDRARWVDETRGPSYYPGMAAFNEYMNWGLVSLRLIDYAPPEGAAANASQAAAMSLNSAT
jgi:hypothetical protein